MVQDSSQVDGVVNECSALLPLAVSHELYQRGMRYTFQIGSQVHFAKSKQAAASMQRRVLENVERGYTLGSSWRGRGQKLFSAQIGGIRTAREAGVSLRELADQFDVSVTTIRAVLSGRRHGGFV